MKNISVRFRILLNAFIFILILIILGLFSYMEVNDIEDKTKKIDSHYLIGFSYISQIHSITKDNFILTTDVIISDNKANKKEKWHEIQSNITKINKIENDYQKLITTEEERKLFDTLDKDKVMYAKAIKHVIEKSLEGDQVAAQQLLNTEIYPVYYEFQNDIKKLEKFNSDRAHKASEKVISDVAKSKQAIVFALITGSLISIFFSVILSNSIINPINKLVKIIEEIGKGDFTNTVTIERNDELGYLANGLNSMSKNLTVLITEIKKIVIKVNSSVTELAATSKEQQATTNEVTSTTAEIGATSKEITTNSVELMKAIESVTLVSEDTAKIASSGQNELKNMEDGMRGILKASGSINEKLATLNEKAGNINSVVTTINKISDQTNLLSLNAAIEAEKAGEYGRGFSVVSNEIRRLADQTAVATFDIEQTVKEIQSAVSSSVMEMDKFSEEVKRGEEEVQKIVDQMEQIIELVQALNPQFEQVREGMDSQTIGANQINDALSQLLDAMEQSSTSVRESVESIEILKQSSYGLQDGVANFKVS